VHGFKGNSEDYYHPDNSCINRVLETKQGEQHNIYDDIIFDDITYI
jgi:regulator of sirC expression with transglutaminase-like and TPR domain